MKLAIISKKASSTPFFYGYVVIAASFVMAMLIHGIHGSYGVFFNPIQAEFGWSRAAVSGASSLAFFLMGLFAILMGRLTDRFGPRIVLIGCGLALGLGYFLVSRVNSLWQLYLFYGLIVGLGSSSGDVTLLGTAARWFVKRRGIMSAVVKVGTGTGMLIMPLVASSFIARYEWRQSYSILAVIALVGIVAMAHFMSRDPAKKGLQPYGASDGNGSDMHQVGGGYSLREAMHTRQLWMVCAMYFLVWYCAQTIIVHIVPHALDMKIPAPQAAGMISSIGAASIIGRLVMGNAGDRVGNRRALIIAFVVFAAGLSWLLFAGQTWALYLFTAVYGFGHGAFFALVSPLVAELFGTKSHGVIFGTVLFIGQIGGAVGAVVAGRIFDVMQSYQVAFIIVLAASIIGLVMSTLLRPTKAKQRKQKHLTR